MTNYFLVTIYDNTPTSATAKPMATTMQQDLHLGIISCNIDNYIENGIAKG